MHGWMDIHHMVFFNVRCIKLMCVRICMHKIRTSCLFPKISIHKIWNSCSSRLLTYLHINVRTHEWIDTAMRDKTKEVRRRKAMKNLILFYFWWVTRCFYFWNYNFISISHAILWIFYIYLLLFASVSTAADFHSFFVLLPFFLYANDHLWYKGKH
jgi:hypothetical protein